MKFGQKKKIFFREIELFDFTSCFWPGLFIIFWPTVNFYLDSTSKTTYNFKIWTPNLIEEFLIYHTTAP